MLLYSQAQSVDAGVVQWLYEHILQLLINIAIRTLISQQFKAGQCFINFFQEETLLHNISLKLPLDWSQV